MMKLAKLAIFGTVVAASALSARTSHANSEWWFTNEYGPSLCTAGGGYAIDCTYDEAIYDRTGWETWISVKGAAISITSDASGHPWIIDDLGHIHYWNPNDGAFENFDSSTDWLSVAVGVPTSGYNIWAIKWDGTIWVFSGNAYDAGGSWVQVPGAARKIAVLASTTSCANGQQIYVPWVVNNSEQLFTYAVPSSASCAAGHFQQISGAATDIASSYVIGTDNNVYYYNGSGWTSYGKPSGSTLQTIGAVPGSTPYLTDQNGYAWELLVF